MKRAWKNPAFLTACLWSTVSFGAPPRSNVIYGEDDRREINEVESLSMQLAARSTALLVKMLELSFSSDRPRSAQLQDHLLENASASAKINDSSINPRLNFFAPHFSLLTTSLRLQVTAFPPPMTARQFPPSLISVFGKSDRDITTFSSAQVFSCKELIARDSNIGKDFALIRLDRPVPRRVPLEVRRATKVETTVPRSPRLVIRMGCQQRLLPVAAFATTATRTSS